MEILVYAIIGLLTFGFRWHRPQDHDDYMSGPLSAFAGIFWPLYWAGYVSITIMKPKEASK